MDNAAVQPVVRRTRLRDDVLELAKLIVHLALVVAPTEIGRLLRAGVEYLWKRATVSFLHRRQGCHTDRLLHLRVAEERATLWRTRVSVLRTYEGDWRASTSTTPGPKSGRD